MSDPIELRHYTAALVENPAWSELTIGLVAERDRLVERLVGSLSDHADAAVLHALRGEIRGLNRVLVQPAIEARRHEKRKSA